MNIVYSFTHHVDEWAIPSFTSLYEHNPDANVYILCEHDEFPLKIPFDATIINVSDQKIFTPENCVNYHTDFKYPNLLKVCYPSYLPVDKVIHLDIDTIICDSLEELWNIDLTDKWFASGLEFPNGGGYKPFGNKYYNMGISLINLEQMRKDSIEPLMIEYLRRIKQPYADQDAWNIYAIKNDKAVAFDKKFNSSLQCGYSDKPVIVHYCSIWDWFTNKSMPQHEYLDRYR